MNLLRSIVLLAIIIGKECILAVEFLGKQKTMVEYLQKEGPEDHYSREAEGNPHWPRLSERDRVGVTSHCGAILLELGALGVLDEVKHRDFEKFNVERADKLLSYEFMELPIEGMEDKKRKVVRISDRPFLQTMDGQGNPLPVPVDHPNGLLIADCSYNSFSTYVFTKTRGKETLTPIFMINL